MINTITVTNYLGESIDLELRNPEKSGFAILDMDGIGPDNGSINIKEVATYDGGKVNQARMKLRSVTLKLRFIGINIEEIRHKSYKYFPVKHLVRLTFKTDERITYIEGYVEKNDPTIFTTKSKDAEGCQISIKCSDPYFYDINKSNTVFSGVEPLFEFPFDNNDPEEKLIEMGELRLKAYNTVYYNGDLDTGITITIHALGTIGDLRIYNVSTRQIIEISKKRLEELTGSGMVKNDTITICTVRGKKSITLLRNGVRTNILNALGKSIDWFTVSKGDNIFAYVTDEGATNLQFRVDCQTIYEGV